MTQLIDYHGIQIDLDKDEHFTEFALSLLKKHYMLPHEKSPQEALARASLAYCTDDLALAQRIYNYASNNWFMFASPVISNAPEPGKSWKAMPASCFLTYVDDTLESLIEHTSEIRWLSVLGGGVGAHWSNVRSVSNKAPGPIPFLKTIDADMSAYQQGVTRRASYAAYLDISHPDILEFLEMRLPTGGDANRKCFNLHNAVNITDAFMQACIEDLDWQLIDPADKTIRDTIKARSLLEKIIEVRFRTGEPFICFIDTANAAMPEFQKALNLVINGTNLCTEIFQPTSNERTAVCVLSSLNLEFFNEWKDTTIVQDLIRFLDNVAQVFIDHAPPQLKKAIYAVMRERGLALGAMGFHSFLQKNMIPWESAMAKAYNITIWELISTRALESSVQLAHERGPCLDAGDKMIRNAYRLGIAPNANSSIIAGASPSGDPWYDNAYSHAMRAGTFLVKNKQLEILLKTKLTEKQLEETWQDIILNQGSVQHLDILDAHEKEVFKTAFEIDQKWVVQHAADRQPYICQGQSVNLFFPTPSDRSYVLAVHIKAWKEKLKSLYYVRSSAGINVDISKRVERVPLADYAQQEECLSCQG